MFINPNPSLQMRLQAAVRRWLDAKKPKEYRREYRAHWAPTEKQPKRQRP